MKLFLTIGMVAIVVSGCKPNGTVAAPNTVEVSSTLALSWDKATLTATNERGMSIVLNLLKRNRDEGKTTYGQTNDPRETVFPDGIKFIYEGQNITGILNTNGEKISLEYEITGKLKRIVYPNGTFQIFYHDANGMKTISMQTGKVQ